MNDPLIMNGHLFVISAPSGTGKTTVIKNLMTKMSDLVLSISCTTRKPRSGEKNGIDYNFVSKSEFKKLLKEEKLLEHANVHGSLYGTPKGPIETWTRSGKNVLLDIDVQGGRSVKKAFKEAVLIFLLPPSREELIRRLTSRGTDSKSSLDVRIKNADKEMAEKDFYDYQVVNDKLEDAVRKIENIIRCSA